MRYRLLGSWLTLAFFGFTMVSVGSSQAVDEKGCFLAEQPSLYGKRHALLV